MEKKRHPFPIVCHARRDSNWRLQRDIERKAATLHGATASVRQALEVPLGKAEQIAAKSYPIKAWKSELKLYSFHILRWSCINKGKSRQLSKFGVKSVLPQYRGNTSSWAPACL
jgi:hypothetical protein